MKLKWYGTASLLIYEGETSLAFDPFFGIPKGKPVPGSVRESLPEELSSVKDIFVTHGHFDHIIQIPHFFQDGNAVVHATATPCGTLKAHGIPENRLDTISPGWNGSFGKIKITAYQGRHCVFDTLLVIRTGLRYLRPGNLTHGLRLLKWNKACPEKGEILFYELECNGKRLQIMGSMGLDDNTEYPVGADMLILPYQGKTDPVQYAASLVERLAPQAVLLDHYDDSFPPMTTQTDTTAFETLIKEKYSIPCGAMRQDITYDMEESTL